MSTSRQEAVVRRLLGRQLRPKPFFSSLNNFARFPWLPLGGNHLTQLGVLLIVVFVTIELPWNWGILKTRAS